MKLSVKISELNYGDLAVAAMPILGEKVQMDTAVGKILTAVTQLPQEMIRQVFDMIPQSDKNEIVALLGLENKERLLDFCTHMLNKSEFNMTLRDISVTKDLEIMIWIKEIDYHSLVKKSLPMVKEKMIDYVSSLGWVGKIMALKIYHGSADIVCEMLDKFSQDWKDSIVENLVNQNQEKLMVLVEEMAQKSGVGLKLESLRVER